eukprot:scaffold56623_cov66-Phaeocystis_antarctica.AAC.3
MGKERIKGKREEGGLCVRVAPACVRLPTSSVRLVTGGRDLPHPTTPDLQPGPKVRPVTTWRHGKALVRIGE